MKYLVTDYTDVSLQNTDLEPGTTTTSSRRETTQTLKVKVSAYIKQNWKGTRGIFLELLHIDRSLPVCFELENLFY